MIDFAQVSLRTFWALHADCGFLLDGSIANIADFFCSDLSDVPSVKFVLMSSESHLSNLAISFCIPVIWNSFSCRTIELSNPKYRNLRCDQIILQSRYFSLCVSYSTSLRHVWSSLPIINKIESHHYQTFFVADFSCFTANEWFVYVSF